jgi:hypothetical protein
MIPDPAGEALAALREHQEAAGMRFENPDAPVAGKDDGTPAWMTRDEEFR